MAERLWAPWRIEYIRRSKSGSGCVLCAAATAPCTRESLVLARNPVCYVMLNAFPYASAHLMIVPARHVADPADLAEHEHTALWAMARDALIRLRRSVSPDGANLGMNLGAAAGAGIAEHLHIHLVPRWSGDHNFMPVIADTRVLPEYLEATWDRLAPEFADLCRP